MNTIRDIILLYIISINIIGFVFMGVDKKKAQHKKWRIKEKTLFFIAAVGGSAGSIVGMQYFHHKTKHKSFVIGMPSILILQIIIYIFFIR